MSGCVSYPAAGAGMVAQPDLPWADCGDSEAWQGSGTASGSHAPACGHSYTLCSKLRPHPWRGAASGSGRGRGFPWAA